MQTRKRFLVTAAALCLLLAMPLTTLWAQDATPAPAAGDASPVSGLPLGILLMGLAAITLVGIIAMARRNQGAMD